MAYTDPWNETDPPGGELARNIDDAIRRLRAQITERLGSILKPTTDPVPKSGFYNDPIQLLDSFAGQGDKTIIFGPQILSAGNAFGNNVAPTYDLESTKIYSDTPVMVGQLLLPPGVFIKKIEIQLDRGSSPNVSVQVYRAKMIGANYNPDLIYDTNYVANGINIIQAVFADPGYTVTADDYYTLRLDFGGAVGNNGRFYACRVTYHCPANINTL